MAERSRRIEIRPTGTNGDPSCCAVLIDEDGAELCEIPARYDREPTADGERRYVVLDLAPDAPPLWGGS